MNVKNTIRFLITALLYLEGSLVKAIDIDEFLVEPLYIREEGYLMSAHEANKDTDIEEVFFMRDDNRKYDIADSESLAKVKTIAMSFLGLTEVPRELFIFKNLESLSLFKNKITEIPTWLKYLDKIRVLDFTSNCVKELPAEISELNELIEISLEENQLEDFPAFLAETPIEQLYLANNQIKVVSLSQSDKLFEKLIVLDLSENNIDSFTLSKDDFPALEILNLSNNKLTHVSENILKLPSLKKLNLKGNQLDERTLQRLKEISENESFRVLLENSPTTKP